MLGVTGEEPKYESDDPRLAESVGGSEIFELLGKLVGIGTGVCIPEERYGQESVVVDE